MFVNTSCGHSQSICVTSFTCVDTAQTKKNYFRALPHPAENGEGTASEIDGGFRQRSAKRDDKRGCREGEYDILITQSPHNLPCLCSTSSYWRKIPYRNLSVQRRPVSTFNVHLTLATISGLNQDSSVGPSEVQSPSSINSWSAAPEARQPFVGTSDRLVAYFQLRLARVSHT